MFSSNDDNVITSFDSLDIVEVDARSVIGNTWQRCESTFSHRKDDIVASAAASGHSLVTTVLTRNKRMVPV